MPEAAALRIGLFTYSTKPRGGVVHTLELASALQAAGHDVTVHALDESGTGMFRDVAVPVRTIPVPPAEGDTPAFVRSRIATYVRELERHLGDFDVYHAQDGISANALATLAERGRIGGFLRTVHHLDDFREPVLAALQDRSVTAAHACFTVSACWQQRVRERYGRSSTRVTNGVDRTRFRAPSPIERAAARAARRFGTAPIFLAIGGIERRKNSQRVLEAFARVRVRRPDARLVIAGGASVFDHRVALAAFEQQMIEQNVPAHAVERLGIVTDAEIVALLGCADALVFPSLEEGFGLVVIEALACGTPVVTSRIAPFTEYLDDTSALLADPLDSQAIVAAMERALDPLLAARLRVHAQAVLARFSWPASADAHVRAYRASRSGEHAVA